MVEMEHVEEIAEGRAVERHIGILVLDNRVGEIIPAPTGQRLQMPVSLDELQNRDVVCICMVNVPPPLGWLDHDAGGKRSEWPDVAVGGTNLHGGSGAGGFVREFFGGVVRPAVVGPGNALFVKRFADGAGIYRWDGAALGDSFSVHSAVRQEPGRGVVDHVEGSAFALWIGMVRKGSKVVANWRNAGLRGLAALAEVAAAIDVHSVLVV